MVDDTSIIEMHDTWLTVNSIVGCTNGCKYCFLQATNDNLARPRVLADAAKAISCLFSSKYYTTHIPVCLLPNTDPFLNEHNMSYVKEMLDILAKKKISNPIILITKCLIPNEFVDYLSNLITNGMNIVVYLSLSGLSKFYEPNINHANIKINFCNLASKGIKIIHYYRPFIPENSDAKSITNLLDFVKDYTNISVITGLKLKSDFIDKIDFWNITSTEKEKCLNAFKNQAFPFDALVKELNIKRDTSRNPLFDTMFIYQNSSLKDLKLKKEYNNKRIIILKNEH